VTYPPPSRRRRGRRRAARSFKRWFPKIAEYENVGTIAVSGSRAFVGGQFCNDQRRCQSRCLARL
jgi:hypothetical protein